MFDLLICTLCVHFLGNLETYVVRFSELLNLFPLLFKEGPPFHLWFIRWATKRLDYTTSQSDP